MSDELTGLIEAFSVCASVVGILIAWMWSPDITRKLKSWYRNRAQTLVYRPVVAALVVHPDEGGSGDLDTLLEEIDAARRDIDRRGMAYQELIRRRLPQHSVVWLPHSRVIEILPAGAESSFAYHPLYPPSDPLRIPIRSMDYVTGNARPESTEENWHPDSASSSRLYYFVDTLVGPYQRSTEEPENQKETPAVAAPPEQALVQTFRPGRIIPRVGKNRLV